MGHSGFTRNPAKWAYCNKSVGIYKLHQSTAKGNRIDAEGNAITWAHRSDFPVIPAKQNVWGRRRRTRRSSPMPLLESRGMVDGNPTAYVCQTYACQLPVTTPEELAAQLVD